MNKIFRIVWSQATQSWVVVSELTKAHKKQSSSNSQGSAVKFSGNFIKSSAIALALLSGHSAYAAVSATGTGNDDAVAFGPGSNAPQARAIAIGKGATISSGQDTIAIGTDTNVQGHSSIVIGKNAKTTNGAEGTVVIGLDAFSEGSGNGGRPNTVVGRGAYTAFGENGTYRLNAATALGFQAGAGLRTDPKNGNKLINNETNADNNAEVLVKAGYGLDEKAPADTKAALQGGNVNNNLTFYRRKHINEATAIGAEARAIGDQSIAIGGQVVAGDGVVALGGNDTDQLRNNKYQVVTDEAVKKTTVGTIDDYNLAYTESTNTVAGQYDKLVGRGMPTAYKSTYGQSGSVVIGMEAHSTTALGTAIGTNSVVRMGAFGATAIGAGSTVQPNAEAAVAIGMGSVANGAYALAGGTASWADYGDIALGYQAKATGKDGAIAMGRATNAQGDSSIMIGGANIKSASAQTIKYQKATGGTTSKDVTETINGAPVTRHYSFSETKETTGTIADAYKELTGLKMETDSINFADDKNKNGHASTSLGVHALSKGDLGTAIGAGSRSDAIGSVALGTGAHATRQNAVAIGTGSTTELVGTRQLSVNYDSDGNIVSDNSDKIAYTFKWAGGTNTSEGDVVSFGSSGAERQLKNVAAGRVAEDSTDAINGSQLNSITKKIAAGFNTSGNVVTGSSGEFTSKKANKDTDSAKKDYETAIRSQDKIQLQVGNNLKLDRNETEDEIDVPDDFNKNQTVKKKIRKADFAYSLNPVLTNLTSAEFKGTDANAPTTKLTNDGVKITPATAGKNPVSLTENGLNNGGNPITNVAGNLDGAKTGTTAPKNEAAKPDNADTIKNNAATVGDVLNAGWNLKEKDTAKDFVTAYDTVNFVDGNGTTVSVENTDGKTSTIIYSVNTGNGLQKDPTGNTISVKPADKSLEVTDEGVKVKAADNTLTTDDNGLKVNTGNITALSVPTVADTDKDKIATVGNVAEAIKAAAWKATSDKTANGENTGKKDQEVKAGDTVTFEADKNIKIAQADGKFTFSTKDDVEFKSVKVGEDKDGKKPVNLTTDKATDVSNNDPANKPTTALNVSSDGKPTQITGVGSVLNTEAVPTTPAGTATTGNDQPKLVNLGTAHGQTPLSPNVLNSAATVRDLANMGWKVSSDKATGADGKGTVAVVETADDAASSTVKFDVDAGEITSNTNGSVNGPTTAENAKKLADDLKKAEQAVKDLPADATPEAKKAAQDALKAAQDAAAPLNKVATAQNVADMINASGFTLKTSSTADGKKDAASTGDEVINPGKAVEMVAGKNLTVKQEANGKVTYATKDDVSFNTVNVGDNTYVDADGKPVTKNADGTYTDSKGQPIEEGKVTKLAPVAMKAEKAKPATNNGNKAEDQPTTALNVSSSDGKPTQITGVGSTLNVKPVDTNPNGTPTTGDARPNLVDLVGTKDAPVNKNAAATVGDLQNMGWVVSTKDGNGYKDVVKNANQVDFKGGAGISVKGTTTTDGVREITISVKDGEVIKPNQFTAKVNGTDTPVTKVGDQYYNTADIDPKTGKPNAKANPVTPDAGTTPTNAGDGYVTGNKVATAIQKSGFVVGKQTEKLSAADFNDKDEKVNPDDELRFADGNNTKVKLATKESVDKDGNKVTTTTVKVDVTGLPVQYTDKNGTPVTKVGDKYFTVDDKGNPTTTEVKPADLTTNMVNPAAAPNEIGAPTTLGNVKSNLPSVNDADKNAKDVDGNPIAGKDNKSAPIDVAKAADIAKNVGNNAATVSDVLNAGWNLQNNGEAKDFVKPYDTVNFVDGKGTKVSVETENGTTSNVKFDIDTGSITNKSDGSVQGPVTSEMQRALKDAKEALNSLPTTAPEAVRKAAEQAVADAENNIANAENKVATAQDVANAINKSGFTLTTSANGGEKISGTPEVINPGKKVEMVAGKNMTVKQESNGKVTYATASNVTFDSVQFGDKGPKITNKAGNINVSGPDGKTPTKITGVAPGEISATSKDAINGSQLHAVASNLNNKINKVGKHADAGTASALAAANIPQAYTPGKSLVGIAAGNYQGQNGLAVGMSRISDNGKIIIRLSGTANSQGKTGVAAGVGYQW